MRLRARRRFRIVLLAIVCLLFQQLALAAYACMLDRIPADPVAMATPCAAMDMHHDNPVLCQKHCAADASVASSHVVPSVPPLALPPPVFDRIAIATVPIGVVAETVAIDRSDPPPRLHYCSLLI